MPKKKVIAPQNQVIDAKRERQKLLELMDDPSRCGPIGEAYALGLLDKLQVEAARRFAVLVRRYARAIDVSYVPAKVGSMERQYGEWHVNDLDNLPAGDRTPEEQSNLQEIAGALREEYLGAIRLLREAGNGCLREVTMVCLYAEPIVSLLAFVSGLDAMVAFFGLEGSTRQP